MQQIGFQTTKDVYVIFKYVRKKGNFQGKRPIFQPWKFYLTLIPIRSRRLTPNVKDSFAS